METGAVDLRDQRKTPCYLGLGSPWQVTVYPRNIQIPRPALSLPCQMFRPVIPKPLCSLLRGIAMEGR